MQQSLVAEKARKFGVRIIKLHMHLCRKDSAIFSISNQLLKSGTSIGANIEEALGGFSRKEFASKMAVAYKEARETMYWLKLLLDAGILEYKLAVSFLADAEELTKMLASIVKTAKAVKSEK